MRQLLALGLLCVISFCSHSSTNKPTTLLVLGDSLSAAYGINEREGWVQLLREHLRPLGNYRVINASITGETTGGALSRLPKLLRAYQPKIVIVELGGNDGLRGYPIKGLKNNLRQITHLSRGINAQVLLLGMQIPPNYGARYTEQFSRAYADTAEYLSLPQVPFFMDRVGVNPQLMQPDGIHPNAKAQPILLDNVLPHLLPLLEGNKNAIEHPDAPPSAANSDARDTR